MDQSFQLFEKIKAEGWIAIEEFVTAKQIENLNIDFKEKKDPSSSSLDNDDKKNLSKAMSAFSNSDGGILVWGVEARKNRQQDGSEIDAACGFKPIKSARAFESNIQNMIGEMIRPVNSGVRTLPVLRGGSEEGCVVVYIPISERRPVRAEASGLKQYFKRSGDSSYAMEHFDIEDMFATRIGPHLIPVCSFVGDHLSGSGPEGQQDRINPSLLIGLENVGRGIARYPFLNIESSFGVKISKHGTSGNGDSELPVILSSNYKKYAGGSDVVVHPGLVLYAACLEFHVDWVIQGGRKTIQGGTNGVSCSILFGADGHLAERKELRLSVPDLQSRLRFNPGDKWSF